MVQWAWPSFINLFYFVNCALWSILTGFFPTLTSQAMLTIPIFDFQSNPKPLSPSWPSLKVRVQGSCVLCAHRPALFIPNQPALSLFFFSSCARMERCTTKVMDMDFLLVWLNEKVRWGHHEMAVRPSHRPHRDQSPYITQKWHRLSPCGSRSHQNQDGPVSPPDLVWSPLWL